MFFREKKIHAFKMLPMINSHICGPCPRYAVVGLWPLEFSKENSTGSEQELPQPEMHKNSEENTLFRD